MTVFPEPGPRLFGGRPGGALAEDLAAEIIRRLGDGPPEALARVTIVVNTERTARAVAEAFEARAAAAGAAFLPQIDTIGRLVERLGAGAAPPAIDRLARRLTLGRLAEGMLRADPALGPLSAADALAQSLAALLDEMHANGVPLSALDGVVEDRFAEHWARSLDFLTIIAEAWPNHLAELGRADPEARRAALTAAALERWRAAPPADPIIAAGSTGSTRATADLLVGIAALPQGAVVLPGFDPDLDAEGWEAVGPEHPQFGFSNLLDRLSLAPGDVRPWRAGAPSPRARLLTEALRPAPATHAWRRATPMLAKGAAAATEDAMVIEAPSPRAEADAIALLLRGMLERPAGRAALITPDRTLARRVTAALARWGVEPDDSAGRPLSLSPPGVFLAMVAAVLKGGWTAHELLACLKHPLAAAGEGRGAHLRDVARLEGEGLRRRESAPRLTEIDALLAAKARDGAPLIGEALAPRLAALRPWPVDQDRPIVDFIAAHRAAAEALSGPALWEKEAGEAAILALDRFEVAAGAAAARAGAYPALFSAALSEAGDIRPDAARAHPRIAIWGPLEARAQTADLIILGGLNEGIWPGAPAAEPWLNRPMRAEIGLQPPERRVGLAAHDFMQAASAPEIALTRAVRADGAPTTPSRWLTRLATLLGGVDAAALAAMRSRGDAWVAAAEALSAPQAAIPAAPRPAPTPPRTARPRQLSVTEIETLIRDPYAVYAKRVLGLRPRDPLGAPADPLRRGVVLHSVMEQFLRETREWPGEAEAALIFDRVADAVIGEDAPPPAAAVSWRARLARLKPWILAEEAARRALGPPIGEEVEGVIQIPAPGGDITLKGRADRIDRRPEGFAIYDYKAGGAPSEDQQKVYAKQLPILGAMAEAGVFDGVAGRAEALAYLILAETGGQTRAATRDPEALYGLAQLLGAFDDEATPYLARAAPERSDWQSDYAHLSRHGEWDDAWESEP